MKRVSGILVLLVLMGAAGCLTSAQRNEKFSHGIEKAFFESKMAEQYRAYVEADQTLGDNERGKRLNWILRVESLVKAHDEGVVDAIKTHMITNGICAQYDMYIDGDPDLRDTSKYIRKRSSQQIRKLIATAEE